MSEFWYAERRMKLFLTWAEQQEVPIRIGKRDLVSFRRRQICYLIFSRWGLSYNQIAILFRVNHSTVLSAMKKAQALPSLINESLYIERLFLQDNPGLRAHKEE